MSIVLAKKQKIQSKLSDLGFPALFVGYAENHAGDVFKMFNPKALKITLTRDVRFLGKYYGEYDLLKSDDSNLIDDEFDGTKIQSKKVSFNENVLSESGKSNDVHFENQVENVVEETTLVEERPRTRSSGPVPNYDPVIED